MDIFVQYSNNNIHVQYKDCYKLSLRTWREVVRKECQAHKLKIAITKLLIISAK